IDERIHYPKLDVFHIRLFKIGSGKRPHYSAKSIFGIWKIVGSSRCRIVVVLSSCSGIICQIQCEQCLGLPLDYILVWENFIPKNTAGKWERNILISNALWPLAAVKYRVNSVPSHFCPIVIIGQIIVTQFPAETNRSAG